MTLRTIVLLLAVFFIYSAMSAAPRQKFVVVIDAGHGGSDHGALENGINEKDVTLSVVLKLGEMINKKLKDTEVVYTRSKDEFISLQKRADIANSAKADIFVSIHCNSVDRNNKNRSNVVGATTYVLGHHKDADNLAVAQRENAVVELDSDDARHFSEFDPTSDESHIIFEMTQRKNFQNSIRFASDVQREMGAIGRVSRGVQQAGFWVLWSTAAPAALIELDFLCNPEQAKFLASKEGQVKLAGAIFNAVKNYERYYRVSMGTALVDTSTGASEKSEVSGAKSTPVPKSKSDSKSKPIDSKSKAEAASPDPGSQEIVAVTLPQDTKRTEIRKHRAETAQNRKPSDPSSHRRRSSASRQQGGAHVEEVMIAMSEELTADGVNMDAEDTPHDTKVSVRNSKSEKNAGKVAKTGKPARRDRDKKTGRRGVKQTVNVDYRILLFVSDEEYLANDDAFKGLSPVASFRENNKFKYTYGESAERKEMEILLKEISLLFPDARVIKCYY